jgi:hypothetical protein
LPRPNTLAYYFEGQLRLNFFWFYTQLTFILNKV